MPVQGDDALVPVDGEEAVVLSDDGMGDDDRHRDNHNTVQSIR